jgi:hypothetical protein
MSEPLKGTPPTDHTEVDPTPESAPDQEIIAENTAPESGSHPDNIVEIVSC